MAEDRKRKIQEVIGLMQKNLECSICLEMMNNPVSTGCGHQFCRFCLMEFLERKKQVPCPLCKKMITKRSLMDRSHLGEMVANVRSLIAAFQVDTGILFSPPRGPQTVDFIPCTPDSIQAKTVTEINGRKTSSVVKKVAKPRNVRISRRKTLDNAEICLSADQDESGSARNSDSNQDDSKSANRIGIQESARQTRHSRTQSDSTSTDLLQCIVNGSHRKTVSKQQSGQIQNLESINMNESESKIRQNERMDSNEFQSIETGQIDMHVELTDNEIVETDRSVPPKEDDEGYTENGNAIKIVHNLIEEEKGPLFETPLTVKPIPKFKKIETVETDDLNCTKNLRSRNKQSAKPIQTNDSPSHEEHLTPDDSLSLQSVNHVPDMKTYSKRGQLRQDKNTNVKVKEWLKSVEVSNDNRVEKTAVNNATDNKKARVSKKELKLKAEEEKLGMKLKHLAEHIHTDKTEESNHCFGFEDNGSVAEMKEKKTELSKVSDTTYIDGQIEPLNDETFNRGNLDEKMNSVEENEHKSKTSESRVGLASGDIKKQSPPRFQSESENKISPTLQNTVLKKKPIFKAKSTKSENISKEQFLEDTKKFGNERKNKIETEKDCIKLTSGTENKLSTDQEPSDSDPYEFKSSQNTPKKPERKERKPKTGVKKTNSKRKSENKNTKGAAKIQNLQSNGRPKSGMTHVEECPIPCTQEKIKKICKKLNQAEDYDLLTCTQEAVDSFEKLNSATKNDIDNEIVHINETDDTKCKSLQQKKVRFREPVISDFIQAGKIDILGYRKAKEIMKTSNLNELGSHLASVGVSEDAPISEDNIPGSTEEMNIESDLVHEEEKTTELINHRNVDHVMDGNTHNLTADDQEICKPKQKKHKGANEKVNKKSPTLKDNVGEITPVKAIESPRRMFKNPMMTPTTLKGSTDVVVGQQDNTMENGIDSDGTDDLDINPELTQFEKPDLEIQPDEVREKLSSQELFVRNVLSSQESARNKPSPQIIEETPMIFSVPNADTFKNPKRKSKHNSRSNSNDTITTVKETPLITVHDSQSQSFTEQVLKQGNKNDEMLVQLDSRNDDPVPESINKKHQNTSSSENNKELAESDETQPPSQSYEEKESVQSYMEKNSEDAVNHPKSAINELESSVENSISLLDQNHQESHILTNKNQLEINANQNIVNTAKNTKHIDKFENRDFKPKKKRKSFMLDEDLENDRHNTNPPTVQSLSEKQSKRKRLSRSHTSNPNYSNISLENSGKTGDDKNNVTSSTAELLVVEDSLPFETPNYPDNSVVEATDIHTIEDSEVCDSNKCGDNDRVNADSFKPQAGMDIETVSESVVSICTIDTGSGAHEQESCEQLNKRTVDQSVSLPFKEIPSNSISQSGLQIETETEVEDTGVQKKRNNSSIVISSSTESQAKESSNKKKGVRKPKTVGIRKQCKESESTDQIHLSGVLISPEDNIVLLGNNGSPEDLFNMNSEMTFVDNSPIEETIKQTYLSEEEMVDDMQEAGGNEFENGTDTEAVSESDVKIHTAEDAKTIARNESEISNNKKESSKNSFSETIPKKHESEPEADRSQEGRKRKRRSGLKGARGFSNRKKQTDSSTSDSVSPVVSKLVSPKDKSERSWTPKKSLNRKAAIKTEIHNNKEVEAVCVEVNKKDKLKAPNELPDLSQRLSDRLLSEKDVSSKDVALVSNYISEVNETVSVLPSSDLDLPCSAVRSPNNSVKSDQTKKEVTILENDDDSSSSEFQLSSSDGNSPAKKTEDEDIDIQIKAAKESIKAIENTFSEIMDNASDKEPYHKSPKVKNVVKRTDKDTKKKKVLKAGNNSKHDDMFDISSSLPDINAEEPMGPLESDMNDADEIPGNKQKANMSNLNENDGDLDTSPLNKEKSLTEEVPSCESDSDEGPVMRKKSKKAVITDSSSDDEDGGGHQMNMTSSSAFSSQSENLTTQDRQALERDLERMAKEMEALKAQLKRGQSHTKDKTLQDNSIQEDGEVVAVEDSSDIDELIEMDDSAGDISDNDLFMSPPPLALSQNDMSLEPANPNTDKEEKPASLSSQSCELIPQTRQALADLDVNRPLSPGRRIPKAFVATGLTLHQVQEVKKLASLNDCKFYTKFNDTVTHVIVKPAKESEFLCDRTLKLFQGIANKCWIVNYYWVMDCRREGHLLPEGPYEIQGDTANGEQHQGPRKSRMSTTQLFDKFVFMCVGDCPSLTVEDMTSLIHTCGGEIVPDVDAFRKTTKIPLIVTCSDVEDEDGDVQVSSQDIAAFNKLYKSHQVVTVSREWILDSLTLYQLQPLKEYVVTSVKNMAVPKIPVS